MIQCRLILKIYIQIGDVVIKLTHNVRQIGEVYGLKRKIMDFNKYREKAKEIEDDFIQSGRTYKDVLDKVVIDLFDEMEEELSKLHQPTVRSQRELLLDFAEYSENDKKSEHLDELVDNYLDSIKQ